MRHTSMTRLWLLTTVIFLYVLFPLVSAVSVDSDFVTFYPGGEERLHVDVENTESYDIEDVSLRLELSTVPFISVGGSQKNVDDLDTDDDDSTSFLLRAATDATPGDYNIPYTLTYVNLDTDDAVSEQGTLGVRISAKTDLTFNAYTSDNAIIGKQGTLNLEIINRGLGEVKSMTVELLPDGYALLSKQTYFIGSVDSDDTDIASFDVVYESTTPTLRAQITYKDFDNKEQEQLVVLPFDVYTQQEAKDLGLVTQSNVGIVVGIVLVLLILWFVYRRIRKKNKRKNNKQ